MRKNSSWHQWK